MGRALTPVAALDSLCDHSQLPTLVDSSPVLLNRGESLKATAFASTGMPDTNHVDRGRRGLLETVFKVSGAVLRAEYLLTEVCVG